MARTVKPRRANSGATRRKAAMALPPGQRSKFARKVLAASNRLQQTRDLIADIKGSEFLTLDEEQKLNEVAEQAYDLLVQVNAVAFDIIHNPKERS